MSQPPFGPGHDRSPAHRFGAVLREWREKRGVSQKALADQVFQSRSLISFIEAARRRPAPELVLQLDQVLGAGGAIESAWRSVAANSGEPVLGVDDRVGLAWTRTWTGLVETVHELWTADKNLAPTLALQWSQDACDRAVPAWQRTGDHFKLEGSGRRVGQADIDGLDAMCTAFADWDHRAGGGSARTALVSFISDAAGPLLSASFDEVTGKRLCSVMARLLDLAGFTGFDCEAHGLAQRYYLQALRLARAADDHVLSAHIMSDMAMQAVTLGHTRQAINLAGAGRTIAEHAGSFATAARCTAMEARGHAVAGDRAATGRLIAEAERQLDTVVWAEEPERVHFFTNEQLMTEFAYASAALGDNTRVQQLASVITPGMMQRRHVLLTATLARSYLDPATPRARDIEAVCAILGNVLSAATSITSPRASTALRSVRRRLLDISSSTARELHDQFALAGI